MKPKAYTIHCSTCARVLGISIEKIQKELHSPLLYCMDCAKKEFNSQESPRVEKLVEIPDYEPTNGVVAKDTRIPSNDNDKVIHPDSLLKKRTHRKCDDKYFDELPVTHCPLKTKQDEKDSLGVV